MSNVIAPHPNTFTRPLRVTILSSVHLALDNRIFYREAKTLAEAGYEVTLIAVHDRDEVRNGVRILGLPRVPRWQRPRLWGRILRLAQASAADIYHFNDPELLLVSPLLRRRTGRPTIYDVHEANPEFIEVKDYLPAWLRPSLAGVLRHLEPQMARRESGLVFADDQIAAAFDSAAVPKATIYNYPDLAHLFVDSSIVAVSSRDPATVLYLGGIERNRGAELMLVAFSMVLAAVPEARLRLVGHFAPPELEQYVRRRAAELKIEQAVTISGRVPFADVPAILAECGVGWVPWQAAPKNELNVPTKLFEYMSAGMPVVASDLASIRPYISQTNAPGLLVKPDDPAAHAAAIIHLIRHQVEAQRMGARGRELVATQYNWHAVAPRLLALYDEVLASVRHAAGLSRT